MTTSSQTTRRKKINEAMTPAPQNGIMTSDQHRADEFGRELDALCRKWGIVIDTSWSTTFTNEKGEAETHSGRPRLKLLISQEWQPPQNSAQDENSKS